MDKFAADLAKFAENTKRSLDDTCRAVAIKWFSSTVKSTPIDTGRLAGNWQVTVGAPNLTISGRIDPSKGQVIGDIVRVVGGVGKVNYLTNNLPYAQRIEYGNYSTQAPQGMVRINFSRIQQIINAEARKRLK